MRFKIFFFLLYVVGFTEAVEATSRFIFHMTSNLPINIPHLAEE